MAARLGAVRRLSLDACTNGLRPFVPLGEVLSFRTCHV